VIGDQDYTGGSDHSGQPFKWPKPAADTPAPIATPEEVEQRDLVLKIDHAANAWYIAPPARMPPPYARQTHVGAIVDWASDGSFAGLEIVWDTAALTSSNAEIERVKAERDKWRSFHEFDTADLQATVRAAEAQVAALTEQVGKLREALTLADQTITSVADNAYRTGLEGTSEWDAITGGKLFVTQDAIRAALSPTEPEGK